MKRMKKFLSMAALALVGAMMIGCSSDDNEELQQPVNRDNIVTVKTTISLDGGADTRALDISTGAKTFAVGDQIAVIYKNTSGDFDVASSDELELEDISADGKKATFTVTLENPVSGDVKYYYPAASADADFENEQDGTLETLQHKFDQAYGFGTMTVDGSTVTLPSLTLENQIAILAITIKDDKDTPATEDDVDITSTITKLTIYTTNMIFIGEEGEENDEDCYEPDEENSYTIVRPSGTAGPIYVAIHPTENADVSIEAYGTAADGTNHYQKTLSAKYYEAGNIYPLGWRMSLYATYKYLDPQGFPIEDKAVEEWLDYYEFTQADIDALDDDDDKSALDKFYECYMNNCDFRVSGAGLVSIALPEKTYDEDGVVSSATVELVRKAPLGAIHGKLYFYGKVNENDVASRITDEHVSVEGDETFAHEATEDEVTQTVTATFTYISAKFIEPQIHAEVVDEP